MPEEKRRADKAGATRLPACLHLPTGSLGITRFLLFSVWNREEIILRSHKRYVGVHIAETIVESLVCAPLSLPRHSW